MNYQKVYMNHIHSSSLLCQLAQMWRSQLLCDALICTGNVVTKAHRVVLLAACPMLQSMENASIGTELEVRLAADIKQEAVNTFLQYLYEGFMLLTEDNVKHVEKVARLLQVDSVIKCCSDFFKCLEKSTGKMHNGNYKFDKYDLLEFRHVRATGLQKTYHERLMKRVSDSPKPTSPLGGKRQRLHHPASQFSEYTSQSSSHQSFLPSTVRSGTSSNSSSPAVVEIIEDSLELVQREKSVPGQPEVSRLPQQKTSISVASHIINTKDTRVVSIADDGGGGQTSTSDSSMSHSSPKSHDTQLLPNVHPTSSPVVPRISSNSNNIVSQPPPPPPLQQAPTMQGLLPRPFERQPHPHFSESSSDSLRPSNTLPRIFPSFQPSRPSFAAGSASQVDIQSQSSALKSQGSSFQISTSFLQKQQPETSQSSAAESIVHRKEDESSRSHDGNDPRSSDGSRDADLSIVKIEKVEDEDTGGLMLHVDSGQGDTQRMVEFPSDDYPENEEGDYTGDWGPEDMSSEGSMLQGDQSFGGSMFVGPSSGYNLGDCVSRQRKHKAYNEDDLQAAVRAVQQGGMSANKAAQVYGIPRRTVSYRVKKAREILLNKLSLIEKETAKVLHPTQYKHILPKTDDEQEYLLIDDDQIERENSQSENVSHSEVPLYIQENSIRDNKVNNLNDNNISYK